MSPEGKAGLFLSKVRKAVPSWLDLISRLSSLVRKGWDNRGNPTPLPKGSGKEPNSLARCCHRATPSSRAGIQPLPLTAAAGERGTWRAGNGA